MKILDGRGSWFKGNLHMHTSVSDGRLTPEEAIRFYRKAGYDFIALTDHRQANPMWLDEGKPPVPGSRSDMAGGEAAGDRERRPFLVMTGAEYDSGHPTGSMPVYHILGIGMEREPDIYYKNPYESRHPWPRPQEIISAINAAGGAAILAHPAWSVMTPEELFDLHGLTAAEIYNSYCELPEQPDRADSSMYFDIWAKNGRLMPATAGDDSHYYGKEAGRSFVMVKAASLSQKAIVDALRRGRFYASQGPRFRSIDLDDRVVTVRAGSDATAAVFFSNSPWGEDNVQALTPENGFTAAYQTGRQETFVRVMLIDRKGRRAWSSPFEV